MENKLAILLSSLLLIVTPVVYGTNSITLSWDQVVRESELNNIEIKRKKLDSGASEFRVRAKESPFYPSLSATLRTSSSESTVSGVTTSTDTKQTSLSLTYNIFNGFADSTQRQERLLSKELGRLALEETTATIKYQLKTKYLQVLFGMRSQASLKEILRRRTDNLEIVRLQYKGGKENKGSLLLAEASVEQTQLEIFSLNATIDKYLNQLCAELGRESCSSMQLVDDTSPFEIKIPDEPQFSQLADSTLRFKQQDLNLKVSRSRWEGARSGFYPKLDASVGMTESGWTMFSGDGSLTSSLVLSIPIFTGGSDYYELAARRLELRSSELQLQYLKSKIQTVLSEIHSNWKAAQIKEKVEVSFLKAARLRAKIARGRYNNGLMSFEDWERLEGELISREKNSITSQRDRLLTAAQWELALIMGDL